MSALPVTIIGGFLGAGKTTLINAMLRHADGTRIAVLVNEFGELAIDEDLIEARDDNLISIAGGCICCSFGNDLIGALDALADVDPKPDHIVIETSGVAIPSSVASTIGILPGFDLNGVIVLADAETVKTQAQDKYMGDTILRQLRDADLTVVTKCDLVTGAEVDAVKAWLGDLACDPVIIDASQGAVPNSVLLGAVPRTGTLPDDPAEKTCFKSGVLSVPEPVDATALAAQLATSGFGVVRAKGIVEDFSGQRMVIHVVGARYQVTPTEQRLSRGIVCIGPSQTLTLEALQKRITKASQVIVTENFNAVRE
ncbi:MAG: CobW family GTP-binding protein [Pseudomonadota bacterium]